MEYDEDTGAHRAGDAPDMMAEYSGSASLTYTNDVNLFGNAELSARFDYQYTDGYTLTLGNLNPLDPVTGTGSREILNLRVGLNYGELEVYVFGENLTDDEGELYPIVGSLPEPVIARPRMLGMGASYSF